MKALFKILLKIIVCPIMVLLWLIIKLGAAAIYLSGLVLGIISVLFALFGLVHLITGSTMNGIILFVIAYLISPYGIPMFIIMLLGVIQRIRYALKDRIYR